MNKNNFKESVKRAYCNNTAKLSDLMPVGLLNRDGYMERKKAIDDGKIKIIQMVSLVGANGESIRDFNAVPVTANYPATVKYFNVPERELVYSNLDSDGIENFRLAAQYLFTGTPLPDDLSFNEKEKALFKDLKKKYERSDVFIWQDDVGEIQIFDRTPDDVKVEVLDEPIPARAIGVVLVRPLMQFIGSIVTPNLVRGVHFEVIDHRDFVARYNFKQTDLTEEEARKKYELVIVIQKDGTVKIINKTLENSAEERIYTYKRYSDLL